MLRSKRTRSPSVASSTDAPRRRSTRTSSLASTTPMAVAPKAKDLVPNTTVEFEVESIYGMRYLGENRTQFNVKWKGFSVESNTWEPLENLDGCMEILQEFLLDTFAVPPPGQGRSHRHDNKLSKGPKGGSSFSSPSSRSDCDTDDDNRDSVPSLSPEANNKNSLRAFEDELNRTGSFFPVTVVNTLDNEGVPRGFTCGTDPDYGIRVIPPNPEFFSSCDCAPGECNSPTNGPCECVREGMKLNDFGVPSFDDDGRVSEKTYKVLWECGELCGCGPSCFTKASQRGRQAKLKIERLAKKGWGVFLDQEEAIEPRTFIARYIGELITEDVAEERGIAYDKNGATYLFDLDHNDNDEGNYCIDAFNYGNESRFFNHSCEPNMSVYLLTGSDSGGDENMLTLSFWTNRKISYGEELTFDYTGKFVPKWHAVRDIESRGATAGNSSQRCYCGAKTCRKLIQF